MILSHLEFWHEPTGARPGSHKNVGLVPDEKHIHQVYVEASLQAGDDIIELVFLDWLTELDWHIRILVLTGCVDPHQGA